MNQSVQYVMGYPPSELHNQVKLDGRGSGVEKKRVWIFVYYNKKLKREKKGGVYLSSFKSPAAKACSRTYEEEEKKEFDG